MDHIKIFHFIMAALAGWVNRHQQDIIGYILEENRLFKRQLSGRQLRLLIFKSFFRETSCHVWWNIRRARSGQVFSSPYWWSFCWGWFPRHRQVVVSAVSAIDSNADRISLSLLLEDDDDEEPPPPRPRPLRRSGTSIHSVNASADDPGPNGLLGSSP